MPCAAGEEQFPPSPIVWALTSHGTVLAWTVFHKKARPGPDGSYSFMCAAEPAPQVAAPATAQAAVNERAAAKKAEKAAPPPPTPAALTAVMSSSAAAAPEDERHRYTKVIEMLNAATSTTPPPATPAFGAPAPASFLEPQPLSLFGAAPAAPAAGGFGAPGGGFGAPAAGPPFRVVVEQESMPWQVNRYQAISKMPEYQHRCFEELRYEYCAKNNKGTTPGKPSASASPIASPLSLTSQPHISASHLALTLTHTHTSHPRPQPHP